MSQNTQPSEAASFFANHEVNSKNQLVAFQKALSEAGGDPKALETLRLQIETQLKIEDFMIRFREADHAKITMWVSRLIPVAAAVAGVVLTLIAKHFTG